MSTQNGKAIFVGNIKGGVGKSTLAVYLTDYLRNRYQSRSVVLLDTDPQGSSFEMMQPLSRSGELKFLPVGDRYDGVNMTTLDGMLRRLLAEEKSLTRCRYWCGKARERVANGAVMQHFAGSNVDVLDRSATYNRFH